MNKTDFYQINKLYNYLNNLDARRFTLGNQFIEGNPNDLGKRKIFGISKAGVEAYSTIVFPGTWHLVEGDIPLLKENSSGLVYVDMSNFFGLDITEIHQICIKKNYTKPNLDTCLRRIYSIVKSYGYKMQDK